MKNISGGANWFDETTKKTSNRKARKPRQVKLPGFSKIDAIYNEVSKYYEQNPDKRLSDLKTSLEVAKKDYKRYLINNH